MFLAFLRRGPPVGRGLERDAAARAGVDASTGRRASEGLLLQN